MRFELFIALRYFFSLRRQSFISAISVFAVLGVGLGVAALIVVLGVMNGFTTDLRDKILGVNAHLTVGGFGSTMRDYREVMDRAAQVPGVAGVTPYIYSEVMLSSTGGVKGVILRGIDPGTASQVLNLEKSMTQGRMEDVSQDDPPGIIIGSDLAKRQGLVVGSSVNLLSPAGRQSAAGFSPKVSTFRVVGVFRTGMIEYDSSLAYISIPAARALLGYKGDVVSGLELKAADVFGVEAIAEALKKELSGHGIYVRHWQEMNANLFAALKLEKTAMFIILVMIVLVGSFSIVTTLVMLVTQKTKDIAVLMAVGAQAKSIRRIFMLQGTFIGVLGAILGYGLGIPLALILKEYQFIKLPSDVYPVDYLPIRLDPLDLTLIGVSALLLCFLSTLYPANRAAALRVSEALRYE
jgi:lipoprotein-releasing system permease protein